ncbi:MAG TPA: AAA domain-containing protein [Chitinophagaceae bacterium]|mgnify:CR=1 FL=1|nr:AAA domain-containing protein [Chitinophagaceae bacterium]
MNEQHPHITHLLKCLQLEFQEEERRYKEIQAAQLKTLVQQGLVLYPLTVSRKSFGFADYPEVTFRLSNFSGSHQFYNGASIELFCDQEEPVKGVLLSIENKSAECRLFAPDFPDWIEEKGVGMKLIPDQRTMDIMKKALLSIPEIPHVYELFRQLHDPNFPVDIVDIPATHITAHRLNSSQLNAIQSICLAPKLTIIHGPPGTGKTSTLTEAIRQLVANGEKVLVSAPSNTAVDHMATCLLAGGLNILRVGNTTKVSEAIYPHTPEGKMGDEKIKKELKSLRIRAEEFRKMALQYKRRFGKSEREQRQLLFKEVKEIRNEIRRIQDYHQDKFFESASVILGTPIALVDARLKPLQFNTLVIDEAGQCLEPLAWSIFPFAQKFVLAGDPFQLPPTVLSERAQKAGLNKSILEVAFQRANAACFLDTQYRMRAMIAGFSSDYFYQQQLKTSADLLNEGDHLHFIDTAGSAYFETSGQDGTSMMNRNEVDIALKLIEESGMPHHRIAFISPYSGQVTLANELLPKGIRISTIDSFQGQEQTMIILSLVRSNEDGQIGFLKDYRRMNVALTRAKELLYVIGDSATLGQDEFYNRFLLYVEQHARYRSVWEFLN